MSQASPSKTSKPSTSVKSIEIAEAFQNGQSVASLADQFKVKPNTINNHLLRYVQEGRRFTRPEFLLEQTALEQPIIDEALAAFSKHTPERLKPVYDSLNEQVSYDQLHLLRVYFVSELSE